MQVYSLEGYRTMCGMRVNADKLVAFYSTLDFLIGAEEVGENTAGKELPFLQNGFHFGFTELQTTNANVEHFFLEPLRNCAKQIASLRCRSQYFMRRCWRVIAHQFHATVIFL